MELLWQVVEKNQSVTTPELTVTLQRVNKEHYVPTEADQRQAEKEGTGPLEEEDYFAPARGDTITVQVSEGEWMSLELGAVYGGGLGLVEREADVLT